MIKSRDRSPGRKRKRGSAAFVFLALVLAVAAACGGSGNQASTPAPGSPQATAPAGSPATSPTAAAQAPATNTNLKLLKVQPDTGHIGDSFTITGEGLPADASLDFMWATSDGSYVTQVVPADVKYIDRKFEAKRAPLGKAKTDAQGKLSASFTAPDDYGETHDIYGVADGVDVAKAGFRILRTVTFNPSSGPVGTPINITVKGMGVASFESTMATLYDHQYTGFITAVKTRGTATFQVRASGTVGPHLVEVIGAATAVPYLNNWQSPTQNIPWEFRQLFTITEDKGAPPNTVEWPAKGAVAELAASAPRTGFASTDPATVRATMEPGVGPVLTKSKLKATGLPANTDVDLVWVTAAGSDVSGWDVTGVALGNAHVGGDGVLDTPVEIPDGLGGWHVVKVVKGDKVLAEGPFRVDRSFVRVSPGKVKVGEPFEVQIKGLGWTQVDNGVAVVMDNAYYGFACGFGTGGDITLKLIASGPVGTHLIDLYPMIYQGARGLQGTAKPPWLYQIPFLTALQDYPALSLGYNLPIFRLAIEVVP